MLKIKFFVTLSILLLVVIISGISPGFTARAGDDTILQEIAGYKNWQRINRDPIKASFPVLGREIFLDTSAFG